MPERPRKILPRRITPSNKRDFLLPPPPLDLLLARNRAANVAEYFQMHQPENPISRRESGNQPSPMLRHPPLKVARHAGVEVPRPARENVHEVGAAHLSPANSRSLTRSRTPRDRIRDDTKYRTRSILRHHKLDRSRRNSPAPAPRRPEEAATRDLSVALHSPAPWPYSSCRCAPRSPEPSRGAIQAEWSAVADARPSLLAFG
jgi:hypothetical protein